MSRPGLGRSLLVVLGLLTAASATAFAEEPLDPTPVATAPLDPAPAESPRLLPAGALEVGVFAPLRYGLNERVELEVHPLWFFVLPHARAKVSWASGREWALASRHGLAYPSILMNLLSREGTGGLVAGDVEFPPLVSSSHHLIVARALGPEHLVSFRAGGTVALALRDFDGPEFWSQIEWHFVWPRTAAYYHGWSVDGGVSATGPLAARLRYAVELDGFFLPGMRGAWATEAEARLEWLATERLSVRAGVLLSLAEFPYGVRLSPVVPLVDLVWRRD